MPPICRHSAGDPNCSSNRGYYESINNDAAEVQSLRKKVQELERELTPNNRNFEIVDIEEVGPHLVMKVKYPDCSKCAYEGNKILVFFGCTIKDAIKWRVIDPHFRAPAKGAGKLITEAPSPEARFPASASGWTDAISFARAKEHVKQ